MSEQDGFSKTETAILRLATPLENYGTLTEAFEALADAREYQMKDWPEVNTTDAGGRSPEEWQLLLNHYTTKLNEVYTHSSGKTAEGRARYAKYCAIVANIALWLVQSTIGVVADEKRIAEGAQLIGAYEAVTEMFTKGGTVEFEEDGCRFHAAPETPEQVTTTSGTVIPFEAAAAPALAAHALANPGIV